MLLFSIFINVLFIFVIVGRLQKPTDNSLIENKISQVTKGDSEPESEVIALMTEKELLVKVKKVIDGDTIVLDSGETLRYIGIDAPETSRGQECFANESSAKNKELVEGKNVRLEKDVSEADRYQRYLRYVWIPSDSGQEIFVNEVLINEGYATAATYPPDVKYSELFRDSEKQARENKRGLWGECEEEVSNVSQVPPFDSAQGKKVSEEGNWECSTNTYNCADFTTQSEAQSAFEACGGGTNDIYKFRWG